jgi:hypothetical protein
MKYCRMLAILTVSCLGSATAENYTDNLVGFSFVKLTGWTLDPHAPMLGGPGTCVGMKGSDATEYEFITICGKPDTATVRIDQALRSGNGPARLASDRRDWRTRIIVGDSGLHQKQSGWRRIHRLGAKRKNPLIAHRRDWTV